MPTSKWEIIRSCIESGYLDTDLTENQFVGILASTWYFGTGQRQARVMSTMTFWMCACVWACVNGGPDLVCMMEACLTFVNCGIWHLGVYHLLHISGACNVCPSWMLWLEPSSALVMLFSEWGCSFHGYFCVVWNCVVMYSYGRDITIVSPLFKSGKLPDEARTLTVADVAVKVQVS